MKRAGAFLTLILAMGIVPAGSARPSEDPPSIRGKTVDQWLAALKDRDPSVRRQAVEILGERSVDPDVPADERSRLSMAVTSMVSSDKDRQVVQAAAFYADLSRAAGRPELLKRLLEEHHRAVEPTRRAIRLVDAQGRPVAGALASHYFRRNADREPDFTPPEPIEAATSNARGLLSLKIEIPGHLDGAGLYAILRRKGRPLVGLKKVTRDDLDKPITIVMHPACRVLFRIDSKEMPALGEKYHAELAGPGWWRAAYVALGELPKAPRPLFASSAKGELEFLLPPGRVNIYAYGGDVKSVERTIEIKSEDRELVLGTFDLSASEDAKRGRFPNHHRVRQKNAAGQEGVFFRRIHHLPLHGMARDVQDVAFSPDGKRLATAHFYNADPGEVMLWDTTTGARVATWPVADHGVSALAFSPDGRILAGRVRPMGERRASSEVILWDVASGRELRRLADPGGGTYAMAFAPDGRILATHGRDGSIRFRDVTSGQEVRRIDGIGSGRGLAFAPDGRTLAIAGGGRPFTSWDLAGDRRAAPAPVAEPFTVYAIAIAADGRTLAAAGVTSNAQGRAEQGQVWLYDLAREPIARRAVLTFDGGAPVFGGPNDRTSMCSDVAFTPDGRRVVAVGMLKVRIWDAATGAEQDAFERQVGSSDRLAVSPDGRWLAITAPIGNGVGIVDVPPGP